MERSCGTEFFDSRPIVSHFVPFRSFGLRANSTPTLPRSLHEAGIMGLEDARPWASWENSKDALTLTLSQRERELWKRIARLRHRLGRPFDKLRTGGLRLTSVIDAREGLQELARGKCQRVVFRFRWSS